MLIKIDDQTRVWEHSFKALFPDCSFPPILTDEMLLPLGYANLDQSQPECDPGFHMVDSEVEIQNGLYKVKWTKTVTPFNPQDMALAKVTLDQAMSRKMDEVACSRGYEGIVDLCTYKDSEDEAFHAEGLAGALWRDAVKRYSMKLAKTVFIGNTIPDIEPLYNAMPVISW